MISRQSEKHGRLKIGTKVLAIFVIIVLASSSFGTNILNLQSNSHGINNQNAYAQAAPSNDVTRIHNYVIFGFNGVTIEKNATINSGNVGTQNATAQVDLQKDSTIKPGPVSALVGDEITIEKGTTVNDVFFNQLSNQGTISGNQNTPLSLPVVKFLPPFPAITVGANAIDVSKSSSLVLQPGNFADVTVEDYATLEFAGGVYNFKSLTMDKNSQLVFDKNSLVQIFSGKLIL